jgi:sulfatase maturation enzyme AslB (radical SAM superfamily)
MEFSNLTFILTEECNFNCSYCFQKRGKTKLDISSIKNALDFFLPHLKEGSYLDFTGGEPLLAFDKINQAVKYVQDIKKTEKKKVFFSITTNGSLIDDDMLDFFKHHKFSIFLSLDGLAQDIARKKGSYEQIIPVIERILKTQDIKLEINSVFTPKTIGYLSRSIQSLNDLGITKITFALDKIQPWDSHSIFLLEKELEAIREFTLMTFQKSGKILISDFWRRHKKEIFSCDAGKKRIALAPDGHLWGCHLFPDFFKGKEGTKEYTQFCFGTLDSFIKNHEKMYSDLMRDYANLRMDRFYTNERFCKDCSDLEDCWACPLDAAFSSSSVGKISDWACKIAKVFRKEKELFWEEIRPLVERHLS